MTARFSKGSPWLLVSLLALFVSGTSWAGPWVLAPGEFASDVSGDFFSTQTYRDSSGERPGLPGGGALEGRSIVWANELGWKKRMSFKFEIPFQSLTRRFDIGSQPEFTQTGFSDLLLGLKYRLAGGSTALALEADWKAPAGYNRRLFPALGNGRQEAIGIVHFGTELRGLQAFFQAAGGYRAILESSDDPLLPKNEMLASADLGWWIGPSLLIAGGYRGRFESSDAASPVTSHVVGPQIRYRVDDTLDVFAGSWHSASGENVLFKNEFYAGITAKKTKLDRLQGFLGTTKKP